MALSSKSSGKPSSGVTYPVARAFAMAILVAFIAIIILRHLFGSIRVEVGTR